MAKAQMAWSIEYTLRRAALTAQGHMDGLNYALGVQGNLDDIRAEIADRVVNLQGLQASTSFGDTNPMSRGASPRIYMDAYLAGLRQAVELISSLSEDSGQP